MNPYLAALRVVADENDLNKFKSTIEGTGRKLDGLTASEIAQRAASHGNLDIIQYLAEMKPAVFDKDAHFASALVAAEKGHLDVVRYLVEKEPPVIIKKYYGHRRDSTQGDLYTLAEVANRNRNLDILLYLAKKEATTFLKEETGYWSEHKYSRTYRYALKLAIKENILDEQTLETLSPLSRYGVSICQFAAELGNYDVVRYFVERDPSVLSNDPREYYGNIASAAAYHSQWKILWYVVEKDPSLLTLHGYCADPPLLLALENNAVTAAKLKHLVQENKVHLNVTGEHRNNIAHKAAAGGNLAIIIYIEETEPSILQKKNMFSRSAAGDAAEKGHWEIVRYLAVKNPFIYTQVLGASQHYFTEEKFSIFYKAVREKSMDLKALQSLLETQKVPLNLSERHAGLRNGNLAELSIGNENPDMFHYLVQKEPTLLSDKVEGMGTVAHVAGQKGYLTEEIISTVVEKIPSLFAQKDNVTGNSFLHVAIEQSLIDIKTLEKLQNENFVTLTEVNNEGETLAHAAASAPERNTYKGRPVTASAKNSQIVAYMAKKQASILAWKNKYGDTVALTAARKGHVLVLEEIARMNPSTIQKLDRQQNGVLHVLAAAKTRPMALSNFELLVRKGVQLTGTNWQGDTSAHIAARNGFVELVEFVIHKEPTVVRLRNAVGRNVAFTAAENAHYNVIKRISDKELLLDRDNFGNTIFHLILQSGAFNSSEFTNTFQNITVPVDLFVKPNRDGQSVVYLAAQVGCTDIIERIAKEKPPILVEQTHNGTGVLHCAVKYSQLEVIKKILSLNEKYAAQNIRTLFQFYNENDVLNIIRNIEKKMTNISERDRGHFDEIAVHYAIESGYLTILKHFVEERKVDVNQPNAEGEPPVFIAVRCKHYDMFKYLAEWPGINLTLTDHSGNNILFVALEIDDDDLSTLKYVLDEKKIPIDVNWRNKAGDTILHIAVRHAIRKGKDYFSETIHYLIETKQANTNVLGPKNRTAIMYAAEHKRFDICDYLLHHGADPHYRDDTGKNFLDVSWFHVRPRRSVEALAAATIHHSHEPRTNEYVPRVTDITQRLSEPALANYLHTPLSLSGFSVVAHVLLRNGRAAQRPPRYLLLNPSPAELLYSKMDPIAVDAALGNQRD